MNQCKDCKFYVDVSAAMANSGQCRRYPPQIATMPDSKLNPQIVPKMLFPILPATSFCGEFQKRLEVVE